MLQAEPSAASNGDPTPEQAREEGQQEGEAPQALPPELPPPPAIISISAGSSHSVALTDDGTVVTWGRGEDGQLGHGDSQELAEPKAVHSLLDRRTTSVHCGAEYTIAVSTHTNTVYSWGWGDFGRLGHGDSSDVFIPRPIAAFQGVPVSQVACGDTHTMVVTRSGELYAFGRNQNGQLGVGHTHDVLAPQLVEALEGQAVVSVACGAEHTIAATAAGQVYGWGWGRYGNLGDGHHEDRHLPTRVTGLQGTHIVKVACGWRHSLAVTAAGKLYSFGWSKYGQLGHGDNEDRPVPTLITALQGKQIFTVAGGWRHTAAADTEGALYTWGWGKFGQLGLGDLSDRNLPTQVAALASEHASLLACGWRHTLAVMAGGQVYSWGRGVSGQLGLGSEVDRFEPTLLVALSPGTLDRATLRGTASPSGGYVSPEDRYAVVPGGIDDKVDYGCAAVPDVGVPGPAKKSRTVVGQ